MHAERRKVQNIFTLMHMRKKLIRLTKSQRCFPSKILLKTDNRDKLNDLIFGLLGSQYLEESMFSLP